MNQECFPLIKSSLVFKKKGINEARYNEREKEKIFWVNYEKVKARYTLYESRDRKSFTRSNYIHFKRHGKTERKNIFFLKKKYGTLSLREIFKR